MLIPSGIIAHNTSQMNLKKFRTRLRVSSQARQDWHQLNCFLQKQDGKLSARRNEHKIVMFYKMKNNLCPNYLSSLIPPYIGSSVRYNLRNVSDTRTVHANTQLYYNSFLPSAITEWNYLPRDIQDSSTVASFITRLNSNIALPPPYYSTGNRLDQIHHTRLRLHCSSLSQHLFSKNIIPNTLCACARSPVHLLHSKMLWTDIQKRDLILWRRGTRFV